jgi:hypothetical protein
MTPLIANSRTPYRARATSASVATANKFGVPSDQTLRPITPREFWSLPVEARKLLYRMRLALEQVGPPPK